MGTDKISIRIDGIDDNSGERIKIDKKNGINNDSNTETNEINDDDIYDEIDRINNEYDINNEKDVNNGEEDADFNESPCIDKPIVVVSPSGTYVVTYNPVDHSIAGWNVGDIEKRQHTKDIAETATRLTKDIAIRTTSISDGCIDKIRVSDDKKLAYMVHKGNRCCPKILDICSDEKIELDLITGTFNESCHTFNSDGEYILYCKWGAYSVLSHREHKIIWIFSTKTKNNKWFCKRNYKIPEYFELLYILNHKFYLFSKNSIYEWDIDDKQGIKIFHDTEFENKDTYKKQDYNKVYEEDKSHYDKWKLENNFRISRNNMYVCLRIMDKIIIISTKLKIPIFSLDMNNDTSLCELIEYSKLLPSLPSMFPLLNNKIRTMEYENIRTTKKYGFGILDGFVWMINLSKTKLLFQSSNERIIENSNDNCGNKINKGKYEHLNIYLFYPYKKEMHEWFQKVSESKSKYKKKIEQKDKYLMEQDIITKKSLQVWKVKVIDRNKIMLRVFKRADVSSKWEIFHAKPTIFEVPEIREIKLLEINSFDNGDIILITTIGFLIYRFNENNKNIKESSISLNYWNYLELTSPSVSRFYELSDNFNEFKVLLRPYTSQRDPFLPLPSHESFKTSRAWISYVKDNKENLLKYGSELLSFAIKERILDLIEKIYKECMNRFEEDLGNNRMFLSIITTTMPLLNKHYPEYVLRYSLETTMIIDRPVYSIDDQYRDLHLHSFQYLQLIDLTRSILWSRYNLKKEKIPMVTFMVPYIKFVNYPESYNWFIELFKPQSSPFVESISREIYKTWNGEAIINFKWNTYGRYYYIMIWIGFTAYLGCFTAAATIPQPNIDDGIQKRLLIASIILGCIHLSFEVRQIIFSPSKWFLDFWNLFDMIAYLLPIYTSFHWLQINEMNYKIISLLSFSCLFLDLKFLLFLRAFKYFGVYFAIMISVAKEIFSFLVLLFIIIISFSHAFYILLLPRSDFSFDTRSINNDPNNPWNLATTYNQIFENGTVDSNPFLVQPPNGNTNMFVDFRTSLFAMYKFLTGDPSTLTNWTYIDNPPLAILIVLFSLLIVVYLMNLLIGLLNNAIEKDYNRVSYLMQKAEILAEIELFYMLPHQRRWKEWFPEVMYYYASLDVIKKEVKKMMKQDGWNNRINAFQELNMDLLKKIYIQNDKAN
ncbi:hypothetical protein GLOIN_2v1874127 [Rhizophagus clarus]|uniref:Ion transport domain-containing protein n=1 Tax=Rhizophagus clarus TaxID=94130 RepID=A0A8H3M7T8_9GLOM|nr:hypothetical protein GLOIN_2v1874127 [Rhizophagus clarus]